MLLCWKRWRRNENESSHCSHPCLILLHSTFQTSMESKQWNSYPFVVKYSFDQYYYIHAILSPVILFGFLQTFSQCLQLAINDFLGHPWRVHSHRKGEFSKGTQSCSCIQFHYISTNTGTYSAKLEKI